MNFMCSPLSRAGGPTEICRWRKTPVTAHNTMGAPAGRHQCDSPSRVVSPLRGLNNPLPVFRWLTPPANLCASCRRPETFVIALPRT